MYGPAANSGDRYLGNGPKRTDALLVWGPRREQGPAIKTCSFHPSPSDVRRPRTSRFHHTGFTDFWRDLPTSR
jgi:hypothetical protein